MAFNLLNLLGAYDMAQRFGEKEGTLWDKLGLSGFNEETPEAQPITTPIQQLSDTPYQGNVQPTQAPVMATQPVSDRQVVDLGRPPIVNNDIPTTIENTQGSMDAMDMMGMFPQNMASSATDQAWESQRPQEPVEEPSFMDKASDFFNEERMARMTIALNSMRLNPDPNIAKSMELKLDRLQKNKGRNATVQKLREKGRNDLADAVESGALKATDAWTLAFKAPSTFQEKLDFIKDKTPEEIQFYKDSGVLGGGGTTINMGNEKYYDAIGKDIATMQATHRERGELARSSLNALNELNTAISSFGETGPDAETKQRLRTLAAKLGMESLIDVNKLSDGQYVEAIKNRMVAEELRRNKGPQTDFDAKFAGTYIPGLGTSTEANNALMNYSKSISLQQTIFSNMSNNIRLSDFDDAKKTIQAIDQLALMSPGAMERPDGSWITFNEFFNADIEQIKNMSAQERLQEWSNRYKQRMGFK